MIVASRRHAPRRSARADTTPLLQRSSEQELFGPVASFRDQIRIRGRSGGRSHSFSRAVLGEKSVHQERAPARSRIDSRPAASARGRRSTGGVKGTRSSALRRIFTALAAIAACRCCARRTPAVAMRQDIGPRSRRSSAARRLPARSGTRSAPGCRVSAESEARVASSSSIAALGLYCRDVTCARAGAARRRAKWSRRCSARTRHAEPCRRASRCSSVRGHLRLSVSGWSGTARVRIHGRARPRTGTSGHRVVAPPMSMRWGGGLQRTAA